MSVEMVSLPQGKEPTLRVMPRPADSNPSGDIFGGWVMSVVDIAGSIPANRLARGRVVTVVLHPAITSRAARVVSTKAWLS